VETYLICRWKLDGDKLVLYHMDHEAKEKAIKSGKIKGTIKKVRYGIELAFLTDSTENLARFVSEAGDGLWIMKEPSQLERIRVEAKKAAGKSTSFQLLFPEEVERAMMMDGRTRMTDPLDLIPDR
jgi:hypothetical protein